MYFQFAQKVAITSHLAGNFVSVTCSHFIHVEVVHKSVTAFTNHTH
ncbi:MAG: hypothetical protein Q8S84_08190 [bacterium]|nr:hypothetical protein [bacterium]MDP3381415.1 hypothetical protein [bacterium]